MRPGPVFRSLSLVAALCAAPLHAQTRVDQSTAEQLVQTLMQPMPDAPPPLATRSMRSLGAKAPDAATNLCVASGNTLPEAAGDGASRSLYVTDAPKVDLNVRFALDSTRLTPEAAQLLDALGEALKNPALRSARFVIAGHTDQRGADDYNRRLSCGRALAARDYLMQRHGIAGERLVALGFGYDKLLDANQPADEVNRRVEVRRF